MAEKLFWELMTWTEHREAVKENPTILVPAGTTETQGPWTFVGFESIFPERLAEAVARRTRALVAPTIPFGYSPDFQDFPGTIMLRPEVLKALYEDVIRSILRHGYDHILVLATHTPNQPMLEELAYDIRQDLGVLIAWHNPGAYAARLLKDVSPNFAAAKGHGADPALSVAKFLEPGSVDTSQVSPNRFENEFRGFSLLGGSSLAFEGLDFSMPIKLEDRSPVSGGVGDPSYAGEELGEQIFNRIVESLAAFVEAFGKMGTRVSNA